jgi:hypothetical protein
MYQTSPNNLYKFQAMKKNTIIKIITFDIII